MVSWRTCHRAVTRQAEPAQRESHDPVGSVRISPSPTPVEATVTRRASDTLPVRRRTTSHGYEPDQASDTGTRRTFEHR